MRARREAPETIPGWCGAGLHLFRGRQSAYIRLAMQGNHVTERQASNAGTRGANPPAPSRASARRARHADRRQTMFRIALLAGAIAIPTVAAQGQWGEVGRALGLTEERVAFTPMPFETAGESFPGSAFYYLEDAPRLALDPGEIRGSAGAGAGLEGGSPETMQFAESHGVGSAAQAFRQAGSGLDKARALQCLSLAVYYEAASESYAGQQAVAQVVLNRVAHPAYPASVCGVVFQGSERRTGCQFSFTCDGSMKRTPSRRGWAVAQSVSLAALAGEVYRPIGLATHYHTNYVNPYWAASLAYIRTIGAHRFYRWKGGAGTAGAFTDAYSGSEPLAAPNIRRAEASVPGPVAPSPPSNDAIGLQPAAAEPPVSAPAPAPTPTDRLPQSGRVREEYANSGKWIGDPTKR